MLFRNADVDGQTRDVRIDGGHVVAVARTLDATAGEDVVDCAGGALLPGLHDHHLHLFALAARAHSLNCGPPDVPDSGTLAAALRAAAAQRPAWIRGVGYHASVAGELDRAALDALVPDVPMRIQERSGALWVLNTAGLQAVGVDAATHDGRFLRADEWLRQRLPTTDLDLGAVGASLARFGITGVTDATPALRPADIALLTAASDDGRLPQRLHLLGAPTETAGRPRISVGPHKILRPDHEPPAYDDLRSEISAAHQAQRAVAVHCVTVETLALVLAVLDDVGTHPGDRIEHGAVLPDWSLPQLHRLGLRVVTQPAFLTDRGDDYLRDVDPTDQQVLYRHAALLAAGVPVAASSDAPFGPLDPWRVLIAGRDRRTRSQQVIGRDEAVEPRTTLAGMLSPLDDPGGRPRRVAPGAPADLVLLHLPLVTALRAPDASLVRLTVAAGRVVYASD